MAMAIELVKTIYDGNKALPESQDFYKECLMDIEGDGISSQIYFLLQQQGKLSQTPSFFQDRLKEHYQQALYQNFLIKNQTDQLLDAFRTYGLEVIPIKGIYFAEEFFGHFAARPTSDIDLLIRKKDIEKAVSLVKEYGFTEEGEQIEGHFHISYTKVLPGSPLPLVVELHWDLVKEDTAHLDIQEFWEGAVPAGKNPYIKRLSHYHAFYMICLHGWRHNLDSLKYFIDIIQMIHTLKDEIDYEKLLFDAVSHKTYKRMVRTLSIVYQQFPHLELVREFPYKRVHVFWEYHSAKSMKQYIDFIDYQFFSYDSMKHCLGEMLHWVFPRKSEVHLQLDEREKANTPFKNYLYLFKKRLIHIIKAVFPV